MPAAPLLPVLPRTRGRLDDVSGKVRDFYTQAKRENSLLESNFHVKARIGFKRARPGGIRLRPLDAASTPGGRRRLPPLHPASPPLRPAAHAGPLFRAASPAEPLAPPAAQKPQLPAAPAPPAEATSLAQDAPQQQQRQRQLAEPPAAAQEESRMQALRQLTASILFQAEEDGSLSAALVELRADAAPAPNDHAADDTAPSRAPKRTASLQVAHDLAQEVSRVAVEEVMLSIRGENPELSSPMVSPRNVVVVEEE